MDFLNPSTYWVGNRCYRVLSHQVDNDLGQYVEDDAYEDEAIYEDEPSCGMQGEYEIEQIRNGKYKTSWHVPSAYYSYLIGSRGATKKRLEQNSGCTIWIPNKGVNGDIEVVASNASRVRSGRLQVELLVEQARNKQRPTHFLSFPLCQQQLKDNLLRFKAMVLGSCGDSRGISEQIFQEPEKLHLTAGVLTLMDDSERETAVQEFTQAMKDAPRAWGDGPLRVGVRGLQYFTDDPGEVRVLWAGVQSPAAPNALQSLADHVTNVMIKSGMMKKNYGSDSVRLHVTVMNTKFLERDDDDSSDNLGASKPFQPSLGETFDARKVLQEYGDFDFGEVTIDEVHVSVMHSKDPGTGYYCPTAVIKL